MLNVYFTTICFIISQFHVLLHHNFQPSFRGRTQLSTHYSLRNNVSIIMRLGEQLHFQ